MLFENRSDLGGVSDGDYVFVSHKGTPLHCGNWRKRFWLPAVKKAGLRICTFTTCVMSLLLASMKRELATRSRTPPGSNLGCRDSVYTQGTDPADRLAADLMGEVFKPPWATDDVPGIGSEIR